MAVAIGRFVSIFRTLVPPLAGSSRMARRAGNQHPASATVNSVVFPTYSLRLLADALVRLEVVEAISHETVRQTLKKTRSART